MQHRVGDVEDHRLREELRSWQHFLVDSEPEKARHKVFNYARENLNAKIVDGKLDHFFNNLKWAAKVNLAFGFHFEKYRKWRVHIFLLTRKQYRSGSIPNVCTRDNLAKLNDVLNKTDVIESCSRQRMNTKWRFYKLTNLFDFAALLKVDPMGCKDAVLPEPLLRNGTINCLRFEENTRKPHNDNLCLFRALALHLHGNQQLEEQTSKTFNSFFKKME